MTVTYGGHVLMLSLDPFNVLDPYAGQPAAASIGQASCRHLAALLAACETVCRGTSLLFGAVEASITAHIVFHSPQEWVIGAWVLVCCISVQGDEEDEEVKEGDNEGEEEEEGEEEDEIEGQVIHVPNV